MCWIWYTQEMYTLYVAVCAVVVERRPREIWWLEYVEETAGVYANDKRTRDKQRNKNINRDQR